MYIICLVAQNIYYSNYINSVFADWKHAICGRPQLPWKALSEVKPVQFRQKLVNLYSQKLSASANINKGIPERFVANIL